MKKTCVRTKGIKINAEKRNFSKRRRLELVNAFKEVKESLEGKKNLSSFEQILKKPD